MKENSDTDAYACDKRVDELLNSLIDGELTPEEHAKVEQLITHDVKIAQRLLQLQKCKVLIGSLPCAEAPAIVLEGIEIPSAASTPLSEEPTHSQWAGATQLLVRKLLSAAAMIGLVAVLAAVIYAIVAPETVPEGPVATGDRQPSETVMEPSSGTMAALGFSGRLELKTGALATVDSVINRAIADNGLSDSISPAHGQDNKCIHLLSCSREGLEFVLADLKDIWPQLDSATLFVGTEVFGRQVAVDAVTTGQIAEIVDQGSLEKRIEVAKDFAALNNVTERLPGREMLAAIEGQSSNLTRPWRIPKPHLTGSQGTVRKPSGPTEDEATVHLTIIVSW
jgi:hypothetical protein